MGGSPSVPQRNLNQELGQTFGAFSNRELPLFNNWFQSQPDLGLSRTLTTGALSAVTPYLTNVLQTQGALTPEMQRDVDQATRSGEAMRGMATTNQGLGQELLNREQYRQQRFQQALGDVGMAVQPALATQQAATGTFATLMNPLLSYAQDLFSSNQNAAAAQSIMGANKGSGLIGGGLSSLGSVASSVLPFVMASDERLKENIRDTGQRTPEGIPIKTFSYKADPTNTQFRGVTAQDVEKVRPDAVMQGSSGHKLVALHALLGAPMEAMPKQTDMGRMMKGHGMKL